MTIPLMDNRPLSNARRLIARIVGKMTRTRATKTSSTHTTSEGRRLDEDIRSALSHTRARKTVRKTWVKYCSEARRMR